MSIEDNKEEYKELNIIRSDPFNSYRDITSASFAITNDKNK